MDDVKAYLKSDSCVRTNLRKIFTVLTQLIIILLVWEFLRSSSESTDAADDLLAPLNRRTSNLMDCFQESSHGDSLDFDAIISRNKPVHPPGEKEKRYILSVDVIIRNPGSDSVTVYAAGTPVSVGVVDSGNQMWKIDYFEYNDDDISNNVINTNSDEKKESLISLLGPVTSTERAQKESFQSHAGMGSFKSGFDSNPGRETARQDVPHADNRVIDLMLVEDQMLKVRPRDQLQQQEILQQLQKRQDLRLLLQGRARKVTDDILRRVQLNSVRAGDQNDLKEEQQQISVIQADKQQTSVIQTDKIRDSAKQNLTKGLNLAWPDVMLDETSEPLYTDGFLERVQRVKSELYSRRKFYGNTFKEKIRKFYLLNNPWLCQGRATVDIVYLVHSQPEGTEARHRLRRSILKSDSYKPFAVVHVFLTGRSTSPDVQEKLRFESELYGDIVQGDFEDTSPKSAWKGLMGMRWVLQFCPKVNFILKINDNVFVDTDKLVRGLLPASASVIGKRAMLCALNSGGSTELGNLTRPFCEGFAVLMTRHLVCSIVAASNQIRVPVIEDYYLYGVLPYVTGGVEVYNLTGNHGFQKYDAAALSCYRDQKDKCPTLATQSAISTFSSLRTMTEARVDKSGKWPILWDLRSVKSYLS